MAKKWYKGLTATAVAMAVAGIASMVPVFAEDTIDEPAAEEDSVLTPTADENENEKIETVIKTDAAGNVETETTLTTTETKEEKDPDFESTTITGMDTSYVNNAGEIIHIETKIETSETTSEVEKKETTEVSGDSVLQEGKETAANTNPSADWDSLQENETVKFNDVDFTVQSKVMGEDENGNTTYTVIMTYDIPESEKSSPITQKELSEALGETLTKTDDNTYTYTNADGKTVTVTVSNDESSKHQTVVVRVNVVKDVIDAEGKAEVSKNEISDIEDQESLSVSEILGYVGQEGVEATYDDIGRVQTVVKDGKTYTFSYTITEKQQEMDISGWTNEQILSLLGSDYSLQDGEIVDKEGHVLTFDDKQNVLCKSAITVSSSKVVETVENIVYDQTEEEAKEEAILYAKKAAVCNLIGDKYGVKDPSVDDVTVDGNTATYISKSGSTEYIYTFVFDDSSATVSDPEEWGDYMISLVQKEVKDEVTGGRTYTVSGNTTIISGEVSWSQDNTPSVSSSEANEIFLKKGKITPPDSAENIQKDAEGRVTSFTYNGILYSYSYDYFTDEENQKILSENEKDTGTVKVSVTDVSNLCKISYTLKAAESTKLEGSDTYHFGATIENDGGTYYYVNGDSKTALTVIGENIYTDVDGNTYTVSEKELTDEEILTAVDPDGTLGAVVKDGLVTITKLVDGKETRVTYQYTNESTQIIIRSNTETLNSGICLDENSIKVWILEQKDGLEDGERLYIGDVDVTDMAVEDIMKYVKTVSQFSTMTDEEIVEYLEAQRNASIQKGDTTSGNFKYFDLSAKSSFTAADGTSVDCVIVYDGLSYVVNKDAGTLVSGDGKDYADRLGSTLSTDSTAGTNGYTHESNSNSEGDSYYRVTGKVAYGASTAYESESEAQQAVEKLKTDGKSGAQCVAVKSGDSVQYFVYEQSADLIAYGYMSRSSDLYGGNEKGYGLVLDSLTMTTDGTVVAKGKDAPSCSLSLTKVHKRSTTETATSNQVTLTDGTYDKLVVTKSGEVSGGSYTIQVSSKTSYHYGGYMEIQYSTYDTQKTLTETGQATGTYFNGDLSYSYTAEDAEEGTKTVENKVSVKDYTFTSVEDEEALSVSEILGYVGQEGTETTYNSDGRVSSVIKDGKTYTFEYMNADNSEEIDISGWTNEQIVSVLGSGYEVKDGGIVNQNGHVLTADEKQNLVRKVYITVQSTTTTVTTGNVYHNTEEEAKEYAIRAAKLEAVSKLLYNRYGEDISDQVTFDGDTAIVTFEIAGIEFTCTITFANTSTSVDEASVWGDYYISLIEKSTKEDIIRGTTYSVSATTSIVGTETNWDCNYSPEVSKSEANEIYLNNGAITPPDGAENIQKDDQGRVISFTYNRMVYSYSYGDLTDEELETLKSSVEKDVDAYSLKITDASKVCKISYTLTPIETAETEETESFSSGARIENDNGTYYYVNDNVKTALTVVGENIYADDNGNTYIVTTQSGKELTDDDILKIVDPYGTLGASVKDGMVTITKKIDGEETLVTYQYENKFSSIEIRRNTETLSSGVSSDEASIRVWIQEQKDALGEGERLYIGDVDVTDKSIQEIMSYVSTVPIYSTMTNAEIITYLEAQKTAANRNSDATSGNFKYFDLETGSTFTDTNGNTVECAVVYDGLSYLVNKDASALVNGTGSKDYAWYLSDTMTKDSTTGNNEYLHSINSTSEGNGYYCVTGKVAYGTSTAYDSESEAKAKVKELESAGKTGAQYVIVSGGDSVQYVVYEQSADLTAYGYMSKSSDLYEGNGKGYGLVLSDLTMTADGKVVAKGKGTSSYSISLTKVHMNSVSEFVTGNQITLVNGTYDVLGTSKSSEVLGGEYTGHFVTKISYEEKPVSGESYDYEYALYDTQAVVTKTGQAIGNRFAGDFTYNYKEDQVDTTYRTDTVHEFDADVTREWIQTIYTYITKETVTESVVGQVEKDDDFVADIEIPVGFTTANGYASLVGFSRPSVPSIHTGSSGSSDSASGSESTGDSTSAGGSTVTEGSTITGGSTVTGDSAAAGGAASEAGSTVTGDSSAVTTGDSTAADDSAAADSSTVAPDAEPETNLTPDLAPSVSDEAVDDIVTEVKEESAPITSVPKTGAVRNTAAAAIGALGGMVLALTRKRRRK